MSHKERSSMMKQFSFFLLFLWMGFGLNSPLLASGNGVVTGEAVKRALQTPGSKKILTTLLESKAQVGNKKNACSVLLSGQGLALQSVNPKVLASQLNETLAQVHTLDPLLAQELWFALEHGFEGESSSLEKWIQTDAFQKSVFGNTIHGQGVEGSKGASRWMSYEEASLYIQRERIDGSPIKGVAKFRQWSQSGERPSRFPSDPWRVYADKGWVDWFHFVGTTPRNPTGQWMSYEEASLYIQRERIDRSPINEARKFHQWSQSGKRPSRFPANPWRVYAGKGWVNWFHFLGTTPKGQWMSYEEARKYIQGERIDGSPINGFTKFRQWSQSGKRPSNFPSSPPSVYADKGWVDWFHFLGKTPKTPRAPRISKTSQWMGYEEAKLYRASSEFLRHSLIILHRVLAI